MTVNLNQIRKEYNNSISEIPEERLKELFSSLYYQSYHSLFIERDDEAHQKALKTIETLINESEPWKVFRASKDAIVKIPLQILIELYNKNREETRPLTAYLFLVYLLFLASETDFLNVLIDYIDDGRDNKCSLEFIRKQMVEVRDKTSKLLEIHQDTLNMTINYYESKKSLSDPELEGLEKLKEIQERS